IMPGMFAEISLSSNHKEEALVIPAKAIMTRGGQTLVAVLADDDIPLLREVQTGLDNSVMVEITAGLAVGETVITTGQHYIIEGEAVIRLTN
ncbi:MAG: efflux RND transporter periplasmic adaptor subunit, partial [Clostridiales bacterium]|nr:efflux RND transporter periplasmic adaptor subunit [Clostridiales bacterium]